MAQFRDIAVNPADPTQRMLLYSNGFIESRGGAPTVEQWVYSVNETYQYKAPLSSGSSFARIQVTDWITPSGYTLDWYGFIYPWGSAVAVAGQTPPVTGGPEYLFGSGGGVSLPTFGFAADFMMDPANSGKGYFMTYDGDVHAVGTGVTAVPHYPIVGGGAVATRFVMDFASKRYWILDNFGRIWGWTGTTWSGPSIGGAASWGGVQPFNGVVWGRVGVGLALYDVSSITGAKGWMLDEFGRVYPVGGAQYPYGFNFTPSYQGWEDLAIIDDGTGANPLRLVVVSKEGREYEFVVSTPPTVAIGTPVLGSTVTTSTRPFVQWQYSDPEGDAQAAWDVRVFDSATYLLGAVSEVQRITITGTPTGGTFTVSFGGFTTTAIAYNASAATVQAALEALPSIGTGNVLCAGGALPGAFVSCTFRGALAGRNVAQMTATGSFTGGSSPAVAITTTTAGVDTDPTARTPVWSATGTGQYDNRVQIGVDLPNGTYRAYMRVQDTAGLWSAWSYTQWTEAVVAPATPIISATPLGGLEGIQLDIAGAAQQNVVEWYEKTGVIQGALSAHTTTAQGYSFGTHAVADWSWDGEDQSFFFSTMTSDGTLIIPGQPATFSAFSPTGTALQYARGNPPDELETVIIPTTAGVTHPMSTTIGTNVVGGADFEDSTTWYDPDGVEHVVMTVGRQYNDWNLALGVYPCLVVLTRDPATGKWEYDPVLSRTAEQLRASNPTAAANIYTTSTPGAGGGGSVTLARQLVELRVLPKSGHLVIAHYDDRAGSGFNSGAISVVGDTGDGRGLRLLATFLIPNIDWPLGHRVQGRARSPRPNPTSPLNDERFILGYDVLDGNANAHVAGVYLDGATNSCVTTPDSASWTIAGVHRGVCRVRCADYTPAADSMLFGQWEITGNNRAWALFLNATGELSFRASSAGTTANINQTTNSAANGNVSAALTDGVGYWLGFEYDTVGGTLKFYKAADAETMPTIWTGWTQIGTNVAAGAITYFNAAVALSIGATSGFFNSRLTGWVRQVRVYDDGALVADPNFGPTGSPAAVADAATYTDSLGLVWTMRGTAFIAATTAFYVNEFSYNDSTHTITAKCQPFWSGVGGHSGHEQAQFDELGNLLLSGTFQGVFNGQVSIFEADSAGGHLYDAWTPSGAWLTGDGSTTYEWGRVIAPSQSAGGAVGAHTSGFAWDNVNKVAYYPTGTTGMLAIQRSGSSAPYTWTDRGASTLYETDATANAHLMRPVIDYGRGVAWLPVGQGYPGAYPPTPPLNLTRNSLIGVRLNYWTSPGALSALPAGTKFGIQYHDASDDPDVWQWVRDAFDIVPDANGAATWVDSEARFGELRQYRAISYLYDASIDAWVGNVWSPVASATLGPRDVWALTNPFDVTQGAEVSVAKFEPSRAVKAGRFYPVNAEEPIVISDGRPKAPEFDLELWLKTHDDRLAVDEMIDADQVLLLRDPFGEEFYCKAYNDITEPIVRAAPTADEVTGIRDFRTITIPMQTVKRPTAGPSFGPFADVS